MRVAKTKALISFRVTAKLICVFVFAYAKCGFSHDMAQFVLLLGTHWHCLNEALLMSILNLRFCEEI